jgi:hypothetical protein
MGMVLARLPRGQRAETLHALVGSRLYNPCGVGISSAHSDRGFHPRLSMLLPFGELSRSSPSRSFHVHLFRGAFTFISFEGLSCSSPLGNRSRRSPEGIKMNSRGRSPWNRGRQHLLRPRRGRTNTVAQIRTWRAYPALIASGPRGRREKSPVLAKHACSDGRNLCNKKSPRHGAGGEFRWVRLVGPLRPTLCRLAPPAYSGMPLFGGRSSSAPVAFSSG